jgi:hypothetical protein
MEHTWQEYRDRRDREIAEDQLREAGYDPEVIEQIMMSEDWRKTARNAVLGTMAGLTGLGAIGAMTGGPNQDAYNANRAAIHAMDPTGGQQQDMMQQQTQTPQQQQQQDDGGGGDDPFWVGGTSQTADGGVQAVGHGQSPQSAQAQAYQQIAQFTGSGGQAPAGIETVDQQERDGVYRVTLVWSPQRAQQSRQAAQDMQNTQIIQPYGR